MGLAVRECGLGFWLRMGDASWERGGYSSALLGISSWVLFWGSLCGRFAELKNCGRVALCWLSEEEQVSLSAYGFPEVGV